MKKQLTLLFFISTFFLNVVYAQTIDTIEVFSAKMNKNIKNVVVLPAGYDKASNTKYPVVYLLHGYGGNYGTFVNKTKKSLPQDVTQWNVIAVCPDGENSWYWDSPVNPKSQFDTYVSSELVSYIDQHYNTIAEPKGRAITGFSMGGHGSLWLAINHPDVFGACGSMSGGVDICPFPDGWEMKTLLGSYKENVELWRSYTVIENIDKIEPGALSIIVDCGKDDFFYPVNEKLHEDLLYKNIPHDYISRPGKHTHEYWNNALDYQLIFFSKFFNKK
ncbi:MAG: alpha/beta hydrolase family protein [Dysgonomonas sp.]|nr:alpha/beta hydrolase family protein [Dysgonomonas sp.]